MWKPILAGTAALAIAGTSLVYAQQRSDNDGPARARHHGGKISVEDRAAFTDARIAALKAGLRLTSEQEKYWPAFEAALRNIAVSRMERMTEMRTEPQPGDPAQWLRRRADMMASAAANLKQLADAQEPLFQNLDDSQKRRFRILAGVLTSSNRHFAQMRRHHHEMRGGDHRAPGRDRGGRSDDRSNDHSGTHGMGERL